MLLAATMLLLLLVLLRGTKRSGEGGSCDSLQGQLG
jgi:hypothetical protein